MRPPCRRPVPFHGHGKAIIAFFRSFDRKPICFFRPKACVFIFISLYFLGFFRQVAHVCNQPRETVRCRAVGPGPGRSGSLLAQLTVTNRNYERSLAHVQYLQERLGESHERVLQLNEEKLAAAGKADRLDLLEFKSATFQKKFPEFSRIVDVAFRKARRYGFNPNLVLSVIQVESAFNPLAVSTAGAYGLMQVRYCGLEGRAGDRQGAHLRRRLQYRPGVAHPEAVSRHRRRQPAARPFPVQQRLPVQQYRLHRQGQFLHLQPGTHGSRPPAASATRKTDVRR